MSLWGGKNNKLKKITEAQRLKMTNISHPVLDGKSKPKSPNVSFSTSFEVRPLALV